MEEVSRARLAALIAVQLALCMGCVDGRSFSAVDVPEHLVEFAPASWEPIALTAQTVYPFGVPPEPTGWSFAPEASRHLPIPSDRNVLARRASQALSTPSTPVGEDLPLAGWHVRIILSTHVMPNFGFCLIFPCVIVDEIDFELRVLAIPRESGAQAGLLTQEVWICEPVSIPPLLHCQVPNQRVTLQSTVLPGGTRSFLYRRRVYRRGSWTFPWHRMWRDEVIGSALPYEGAYQRVVDDMLRELTRDLRQAEVLIPAELAKE